MRLTVTAKPCSGVDEFDHISVATCSVLISEGHVAVMVTVSALPPPVEAMQAYVDAGLTTFDMADIYGPAEELYGLFNNQVDTDISNNL